MVISQYNIMHIDLLVTKSSGKCLLVICVYSFPLMIRYTGNIIATIMLHKFTCNITLYKPRGDSLYSPGG